MYRPAIQEAEPLREFHFPEYEAVLLGDIQSAGLIKYEYVLQVIHKATRMPCLYVAAEENEMANVLGGGSHFLCVFQGGDHRNYGDSDDWADVDKFATRALQLASETLGTPVS